MKAEARPNLDDDVAVDIEGDGDLNLNDRDRGVRASRRQILTTESPRSSRRRRQCRRLRLSGTRLFLVTALLLVSSIAVAQPAGSAKIIQIPLDDAAPQVSAAASPSDVKLGARFTVFVT